MATTDSTAGEDAPLECLRQAIEGQKSYLSGYETQSEALTFETIRTLDDLFCRDLMDPTRHVDKNDRLFREISTWGVNHSLRRVLPRPLQSHPFRDFPSRGENQEKADDFVFNCGALAVSERLEGWLREGILSAELIAGPKPTGVSNILVLKDEAPSCHGERIGLAGLRWACDEVWIHDRGSESRLEERHKELEPELCRRVKLVRGQRMTYSSTKEIDNYFEEWAALYLRRIFSQDMIGIDDLIGGRPFSRYLDVLTALSGRSQKHIAFSAILLARHRYVHIRNLLTTYCDRDVFVDSLAKHMDADRSEVDAILESFCLSGSNLDAHTLSGDVTWAPIVQASRETLILPIYGIDINPFLFLLTDLRFRYESDWFRIANNREHRWVTELEELFPSPRWVTSKRNLKLRDGNKVLTDIDFLAFDTETNELGLFQLKWQHPIGMDNRTRRSAGKNLLHECNQWINTVLSWIEHHGVSSLMEKLGIENRNSPSVELFVLGRYHVHYSGYSEQNEQATWASWSHFRKVYNESSKSLSAKQLASHLRNETRTTRANIQKESMAFPLQDTTILVNPTAVPAH